MSDIDKYPHEVLPFIGTGATIAVAIARATEALDEWYLSQQLLFEPDGGSVFQFNTAAFETAGEHTFIITVFTHHFSSSVFNKRHA